MDRLARVRRELRRRRAQKTVPREHAWTERVVVPPLAVAVEHPKVARSEHLDTIDAVGVPAERRSRRFLRVPLPREAHVGRGDRLAVLPGRVAQTECRDETSARGGRVVGHHPEGAVLERGHGLGEPRHELVVLVTDDQRFGHGRREKTRGRVVVEHRARLADQPDDEVTPRRRRRGARRPEDDAESDDVRGARGGDQRGVAVGLVTISTCSTSTS